jgi:hypothetical protein
MKAFVPTLLWLALSLLLSGCGQNPRIDVTPGIENGRVVFSIAARGMNGLLGFAVMDGTNTLWEVSTSYEQGTRIVYGVLPTGGNMAARQVVPATGVLAAPIGGMVVTVRLDYQYDAGFAPRVGHFEKSMQIPNGEPDGAANGSQPIRSENNSTSSAAGSRP